MKALKPLYACIMALTFLSYALARASDDSFEELQEHVERLQQEEDWNEVSLNQMANAIAPIKQQPRLNSTKQNIPPCKTLEQYAVGGDLEKGKCK